MLSRADASFTAHSPTYRPPISAAKARLKRSLSCSRAGSPLCHLLRVVREFSSTIADRLVSQRLLSLSLSSSWQRHLRFLVELVS